MGRSYKDIKFDLWYNLDKIGILPGDVGIAIKGNPGNKVFSHGRISTVAINNGASFRHGEIDTSGGYIHMPDTFQGYPIKQTLFLACSPYGAQAGKGLYSWASSPTSANPNVFFQRLSSTAVRWFTVGGYKNSFTVNDGEDVSTAIVLDYQTVTSTGIDIYYNGLFNQSSAHAGTGAAATTQYIGSGFGGSGTSNFYCFFKFNKLLTSAQVSKLSRNYRRIWKERPYITYFDQQPEPPLTSTIIFNQNLKGNLHVLSGGLQ